MGGVLALGGGILEEPGLRLLMVPAVVTSRVMELVTLVGAHSLLVHQLLAPTVLPGRGTMMTAHAGMLPSATQAALMVLPNVVMRTTRRHLPLRSNET